MFTTYSIKERKDLSEFRMSMLEISMNIPETFNILKEYIEDLLKNEFEWKNVFLNTRNTQNILIAYEKTTLEKRIPLGFVYFKNMGDSLFLKKELDQIYQGMEFIEKPITKKFRSVKCRHYEHEEEISFVEGREFSIKNIQGYDTYERSGDSILIKRLDSFLPRPYEVIETLIENIEEPNVELIEFPVKKYDRELQKVLEKEGFVNTYVTNTNRNEIYMVKHISF